MQEKYYICIKIKGTDKQAVKTTVYHPYFSPRPKNKLIHFFMNAIKRIVLTGGPCAGKTSALKYIIEHCKAQGYKVFCVPEVPTMISKSGWNYLTSNYDFYYEGEKAILELQLHLEDAIYRMAQTRTEPCLIVCDRGTMDISAYIAPEMWEEITAACGTSTAELRSILRYDAVFHLVSAAKGAQQYYTTANNEQRYEKADAEGLRIACELDQKAYDAWTGHPNRYVIGSNENFEQKMKMLIERIDALL